MKRLLPPQRFTEAGKGAARAKRMRARPADAPCGAKHRASGPVPPEALRLYGSWALCSDELLSTAVAAAERYRGTYFKLGSDTGAEGAGGNGKKRQAAGGRLAACLLSV